MESPAFSYKTGSTKLTGRAMPLADSRYVVAGLAVVAAIMLVPLLSVAIPPLTDLPNHISRMHILATFEGDPDLQRNYMLSWGAIPNLAMDVLGLPLARTVSPYAAGKAFAVLAFATGLLGMFAVHYAVHRSVNAWTGIIFFAAYNQSFMIGLLNFYFGLGLAFLLLAAWIMYARERPALTFWLFPAGALAVYFSHLLAFGIYGLLIAGYEFSNLLQSGERRVSAIARRAVAAGAQFLPPLALFVLTAKSTADLDGVTIYGSILKKFLNLLAAFRVYVEIIDLVTILFLVILLSVVCWKKRFRIGTGLAVPLLVVTVLALVAPAGLLSLFGVDQRFAIVSAMLLLAALRIDLPTRGAFAVLFAAGFALLVWRAAELTIHWRVFDAQFAELRAAAKVMDRGASVLPVQWQSGERVHVEPLGGQLTYWHAASIPVVERSLFNPLTFTARHQPIKSHPSRELMNCNACRPLTFNELHLLANPEISRETLEIPYDSYFRNRHAALWPERFDYVLVIDYGDHENPVPKLLIPRHTGSFFVIYENRGRPRG
jgi:hypothetical protein